MSNVRRLVPYLWVVLKLGFVLGGRELRLGFEACFRKRSVLIQPLIHMLLALRITICCTQLLLFTAFSNIGLGNDPSPRVEPLLECDHHEEIDNEEIQHGRHDDGKRQHPEDGSKPLHSKSLLFEDSPVGNLHPPSLGRSKALELCWHSLLQRKDN